MHCNNIFKEGAMKIKRSRNFTSPGDRLKGHIAQFKYIISHSTYQPFLRINLLSLSFLNIHKYTFMNLSFNQLLCKHCLLSSKVFWKIFFSTTMLKILSMKKYDLQNARIRPWRLSFGSLPSIDKCWWLPWSGIWAYIILEKSKHVSNFRTDLSTPLCHICCYSWLGTWY